MVGKKTIAALNAAAKQLEASVTRDPFAGSKSTVFLRAVVTFPSGTRQFEYALLRLTNGIWYSTGRMPGHSMRWQDLLAWFESRAATVELYLATGWQAAEAA